MASAIVVEARDLFVYAVHVVCDCLALDLAVGEEGVVSEIVGADPDGINCAFGLSREKFGAIRPTVLRICDESREFVASNVRKGCVYGSELTWCDLV